MIWMWLLTRLPFLCREHQSLRLLWNSGARTVRGPRRLQLHPGWLQAQRWTLGSSSSFLFSGLDLEGDRNLLCPSPQHLWQALISLPSQRKEKAFLFPGPTSQPRNKWAASSITEYTGRNETLLRSLSSMVCVKTKYWGASCLDAGKAQTEHVLNTHKC